MKFLFKIILAIAFLIVLCFAIIFAYLKSN